MMDFFRRAFHSDRPPSATPDEMTLHELAAWASAAGPWLEHVARLERAREVLRSRDGLSANEASNVLAKLSTWKDVAC